MKARNLFVFAATFFVIVLLILAFVAFVPSNSISATRSTGGSSIQASSSFLDGNNTISAIFVTSFTNHPVGLTTSTTSATTTSTSYSTVQSTSSSTSEQAGGEYTYTSSSQVKILSVAAQVSGSQGSTQVLVFKVQFENIGSGKIYVQGGGGSSLTASITSGEAVLKQVNGPRCEMVTALVPLNPGENWTSVTPGCWSGYYYQLLGPGTIQVELTLSWYSGEGPGGNAGSTVITAQFTLS